MRSPHQARRAYAPTIPGAQMRGEGSGKKPQCGAVRSWGADGRPSGVFWAFWENAKGRPPPGGYVRFR